MEEEINICEEFINLSFLYGKLSFTKTQLYEYQTAIKNLLTRYKQLEKENKSKQKAYDDCYCEYKHYKQFDSIPKSKVKEKIEELDKRIDFLNTELTKCYIEREKLGTETDIDNNETYIFYMEEEKNFREKQEEVLQELLREE